MLVLTLSAALHRFLTAVLMLQCYLTVSVNRPSYPAFFVIFSAFPYLLDLNQAPRSKVVVHCTIAPGLLKGSWPRLLSFFPFLPLVSLLFFALYLSLRSLASSPIPSFFYLHNLRAPILYKECFCIPGRVAWRRWIIQWVKATINRRTLTSISRLLIGPFRAKTVFEQSRAGKYDENRQIPLASCHLLEPYIWAVDQVFPFSILDAITFGQALQNIRAIDCI